MATKATRNGKIICGLCNAFIDEIQYRSHVAECGMLDKDYEVQPALKVCALCGKEVKDLTQHYGICTGGNNPTNNKYENRQQPTITPIRQQTTPYVSNQTNTKECVICFEMIAENVYADHLDRCDACISGSSSSSKSKPTIRSKQISCFTCSSAVDLSKGSSHTLPCRLHHMYCLKCLQHSMNEYIQSNTVPVCHSTLCDYELSRYDVACLPLEADTIKRLLTCVKSTQRAQCPLCVFYVDFNTMNDFQKHVASCNSENMIPCEYCHCLYNIHRLDDHSRQCRNLSSSQQQQALIDFILPRTKYPLTAQQIRVFIENRKKTHLSLDPHSIVETLAEFGDTFPFEIPTRDCDVCMETCVYDDIFVFGCEESHKLCYGCFENSCTTKMTNNEILTCGLCAYELHEGEIKQLRVADNRKKQFLDYQIQKTFNTYVGGTQGVIRCPNQTCKWVAEARDPNDRFRVQCPMCGNEFCSLCNQQYHFRTTCQQLPEITQRWFFWCNTERGNYWQARAQQDANFRAQLEDYERQKAANIQRNQELAQRYNDLLADENYKAQNCRLCPHCRRVVQHLSGCDLMVCGRNYHGGDQQSGCGNGFNWSQALPYTPIGNTGPQQVANNLPSPEQQKLVVHEGVQCDACHNVVQGIRFDCVHCASLTFCEKCEQRSTLEHSNEIRNQQKPQHVFQLIARSLNGNNGQ
ncbi:unnamed protein product [Rotaria sordida]|uniref:RBR-type E3 ubiquitin transferase n=1 Tax=Rotaria sordida TaxID=392033 RepID=A0A814BYJ8_9BILA|nr:unnamed protein product [Rotaria sordida]